MLGAKPLETDGRAFYYSDYHAGASKTYFPDAWPCCSGTLPQVAADYRILTYFREPGAVFVNLYLPSTLNWVNADGARLSLTQSGDYPLGGRITFSIQASRRSRFALHFRIPAWSAQASPSIRVNGGQTRANVRNGFATLRREWKEGDRVELKLALSPRLEAIDPTHPETVALVRGPLVLFGIGTTQSITREQLLSAGRDTGPVKVRPFFQIGDEPYNTYWKLS